MTNADLTAAAVDLHQLRERVRADRRTVTAPLIVFGVLIVVHDALAVLAGLGGAGARHLTALLYWPVAGAVGLFALWNYTNRLSTRDGVGGGPRSYRPISLGYVVSVPLIAVLFLPVFFVGVWASLVWPAAILFAVAVRQHSRTLKAVAATLVVAGLVEGLLAARSQAWGTFGFEAAVGVGLVVLAVVSGRRTQAG